MLFMRLIARFAKEEKNYFEIITVYDTEVVNERIEKVTPTLTSIALKYPSAVWFERKISDDFGIEIIESSDNQNFPKHHYFPKNTYPMRKIFSKLDIDPKDREDEKVTETIGTVLGPVQPYHLESSQFQLFDRNGQILHFESIPFYKYRAIEKMVEGMDINEAKPIIERISGTSSIAYQLAYLEIQLQASKRTLPTSLKIKHMFFLEFERVINHLSDLGEMSESIHFKEGVSFFTKLVEYGREIMHDLTGHRFGFSITNMENTVALTSGYEFLRYLEKELLWFEKWLKDKPSFWKKLLDKGFISKEETSLFGLVGLVARSSEMELDRRSSDKIYMDYGFVPAQEGQGEVSSRFKIRLTEIHTSLRIMRRVLDNKVLPFFLGSFLDGEYYSYIESSAGELMMYLKIKDEKIERFFVRDPSFLNLQVLSRCLKGDDLESLRLVIKSIPISFSANDL